VVGKRALSDGSECVAYVDTRKRLGRFAWFVTKRVPGQRVARDVGGGYAFTKERAKEHALAWMNSLPSPKRGTATRRKKL
jgi:hypothetical protein